MVFVHIYTTGNVHAIIKDDVRRIDQTVTY